MSPRAFTAGLAAVLLGACSVGPDFQRPEAPPSDGYGEEAPPAGGEAGQRVLLGQASAPEWWHALGSPALDRLIEQALAGNQDLAAAAATLAQAQEFAAAQAGGRYPQVGLTGGSGRQKYGQEFLGDFARIPAFTYFAVGATVSYTLDYTGGVARSVEQSRALAELQRERLAAADLALAGNVAGQALAIASLQAQIATVQLIEARDQDIERLVHEELQRGAVAYVDEVSARSQSANDETLLPPLRQQLSVARHALAVLLGKSPASWQAPDFQLAQFTLPSQLPVSLPSELAHRRPDILAAEAQLHAATAAVGVATANLYPRITLSGTWGPQSTASNALFQGENVAWGVIAGITAPVFDAGTLRAQRRAAIDAMHGAAARYRQTVLEAFGQVANLLDALQHDAAELAAQSRARAAAEENLALARKSYQEGNTGLLAVLDAERLSRQAQLGYVRAAAQRLGDTVQLFLALGGRAPA